MAHSKGALDAYAGKSYGKKKLKPKKKNKYAAALMGKC